jgi:hypothetical protein
LNIDVGGTATGAFDKLAITAAATLAGTLNIAVVPGFVPASGNLFQILSFNSRTGTFGTITGDVLPFSVQQNTNNVTLLAS